MDSFKKLTNKLEITRYEEETSEHIVPRCVKIIIPLGNDIHIKARPVSNEYVDETMDVTILTHICRSAITPVTRTAPIYHFANIPNFNNKHKQAASTPDICLNLNEI